MFTKKAKLGLVIALAAAVLTGVWLGLSPLLSDVPPRDASRGVIRLALAAPVPTFLQEEAGISAYVKATGPIGLDKARKAYHTVEQETTDYIIGQVAPEGYPALWYVRVYASRDGWIVAYYSKLDPASRMVDIQSYAGKAIGSLLDMAIASVATQAGVGYGQVAYYDFRYPDANSLLLIGKIGTESFQMEIPSALTVFERSYSFKKDANYTWGYLLLDGQDISGSVASIAASNIPASKLMPGISHSFSSSYGGSSRYVIGVVYRE